MFKIARLVRLLFVLALLLLPRPAMAVAGLGTVSPILGSKTIIWTQNTDFCSAGGGVSSNLRFTGVHLGGVTAVTTGGFATTIVSQNVNNLVLTTPVDTTHSSDGESSVSTVSITALHGNLTKSIWFLPAQWAASGGGAWSAQWMGLGICRPGSGTCVAVVYDQSGNGNHLYPRTNTGNTTAYALTGGGSKGNLPYWIHSPSNVGSNNDALISTSNGPGGTKAPTFGTTMDWYVAGQSYATSNAEAGFFSQASVSEGAGEFLPSGTFTNLTLFSASSGNHVVISANTDFYTEAYILSSSATSFINLNGGTNQTGSAGALTTGGSGVLSGGWLANASTFIWNGRVYQIFVSSTAYSTTGRANFAAYFAAKGL